tara:strand:- start:772 stop:2238 length:1467 start_codon:yes stop_codon:yes gene_type:complete
MTSVADFPYSSARSQTLAITRRQISAVELLDAHIAHLSAADGEINAVVTLDIDRAREQAMDADAALARGMLLGPLHGLPMTIKDSFALEGMTTTAGAKRLRDYQPTSSAAAAERLRNAGAVVFGKTNLCAYADDFQTYNEIFGTTNNPWDLTRTPGGSSGGSAAAVAAGLTPLELGSDIGGSIRNPSHFCGVFGHKPTYGIVPFTGHIPPPPENALLPPDIAVAGPLARTADDLELALHILAGPVRADATAWQFCLPPPRGRQLSDFRIAAWLDDDACPVDRDVAERLRDAIEAIRNAGATVDETARPGFELAEAHSLYLDLLYAVYGPAMSDDAFARYRNDSGSLQTPATFVKGVSQSHREWLRNDLARRRIQLKWADFFQRYDALLCPAAPLTAFAHDHSEPLDQRQIIINGSHRPYLDMLKWAGFVGMSHLPATVAPIGVTSIGLPVGVQIVGPYLEDRTPLRIAALLEEIFGFHPPPEVQAGAI